MYSTVVQLISAFVLDVHKVEGIIANLILDMKIMMKLHYQVEKQLEAEIAMMINFVRYFLR